MSIPNWRKKQISVEDDAREQRARERVGVLMDFDEAEEPPELPRVATAPDSSRESTGYPMSTKDDWHDWIDALEGDGVNLTAWETDFVESIRVQLRAGRTLSEKQAGILERIYADRTP